MMQDSWSDDIYESIPDSELGDELKAKTLREFAKEVKKESKPMDEQQGQPDEQWKGIEEFDNQLIMDNDTTTQVYWHKLSKNYDYTSNGWTSLANDNLLSIVETHFEELDDRYRLVALCRRYMYS